MPIAPKFQVKYIYELALQIKRAPEKVRRKQIEAAEELLLDLDEGSLYPLDYAVYRITQYRSDSLEQPMIAGSALIGDIVSLIAIISRTLDTGSEGMLTVAQAANYLTVSTRTLSRLRQVGLVFYWVVDSDGRRRLGCTEEMLQAFKDRKNERLTSASHFSRLSIEERKKIIDSALEYKGSGRTLNDVALQIANETGRGHETIRGLLQSDARANESLHHVFVNANGGGYTGQAGAILLGLGRALAKYDPSLDGILRSNGFLSRDPRRVERKKPGQPGARKRFQFSKR